MNQLIKEKAEILSKINYLLIIIFPISLLAGSLISNSVIILISIFFLFDLLKKKELHLLSHYNFYFLILIYIYLVFNSLLIASNSESIIRAIGFIRFIIFTYALAYYLPFFEKKIIKFWTITFFIVTADIFFEFIVGKNILGFSSDYGGRIASFTGDELKIGGFYLGFFLICLSYFKSKNKNFFLLILLLFLITSFIIGERSNFIKVLITSTLFLFFFYPISWKKKISFFLVILFFIQLTLIAKPNLVKRYYQNAFFLNLKEKIFSQKPIKFEDAIKINRHFDHYIIAINIFKDNPFYGTGVKTFRFESYKKKYNVASDFNNGSTHPHQFHFEILSELGIIGYLLIISNILIIMIKQKKINNNFLKIAGLLYLTSILIPILPSGSFFTSYSASFFWLNYSFLIRFNTNRLQN